MSSTSSHSGRSLSIVLGELGGLPGPRYAALADGIAALLLDGRLGPGARLPSERQLSAAMKISRATATAAYARLAEAGFLDRRRGSGSFLRLPNAARVGPPTARVASSSARQAFTDLSVASLPAIPDMVEKALAEVGERLSPYLRGDGYHPYGLHELRELIAERYRQRGVPTEPDNILTTNGAQHGIDLVLRGLTLPGDRVLTELPTYPGALQAIAGHQLRAVTVPMNRDPYGWDCDSIESTLARSAPALAYLMPDFHNPTGALAGSVERERIARAARRAGARIVVDESLAELDLRTDGTAASGPVPMAIFGSSIISIGSLSKSLWSGLRVGWIRADADTIHRLTAVRAQSDMAGPVIEQVIGASVLSRLPSLIAPRLVALREQRDALVEELQRALPAWRVESPAGGLSTWIELDRPASTALSHRLEERGVLINPGITLRDRRQPRALPPHTVRGSSRRAARRRRSHP